MADHHCHARNCLRQVPRKMLMCRRHWFMVPKALRNAVWATYVEGQEIGLAEPSKSWHGAADAAIAAVAEKEKREEVKP